MPRPTGSTSARGRRAAENPRRGMKLRGIRVCAAALVAALTLLVATATASAGTADYVSLGDSYVAGPFIPPPIPPWGCLKSGSNYAHLVALKLSITLVDPSCSGAKTDHMT